MIDQPLLRVLVGLAIWGRAGDSDEFDILPRFSAASRRRMRLTLGSLAMAAAALLASYFPAQGVADDPLTARRYD